MGKYDDLLAAVAAPASPAPAKPSKYADLHQAVQEPSHDIPVGVRAPAPEPQQNTIDAINHGITRGATFGAGSVISAAIDQAINKVLPQSLAHHLQSFNEIGGSTGLPLDQTATLQQRIDAYNGQFQRSAAEHPIATAAGETGGGFLNPIPGAVTERAVAKTGSALAGSLAGGATAGALTGAGEAAAQGLDPVTGLKQAGAGAELGALGGAAAHGLAAVAGAAANKASKALQEKYVQTFGSEVMGMTGKKAPLKSWSAVLGKPPEAGVEERAAQKYVASQEMAPVEAAARHGKYDQAIEEIELYITEVEVA